MLETEFKLGPSAHDRFFSLPFIHVLEQQWLNHFGTSSYEYILEKGSSLSPEARFMNYSHEQSKFGLALEHLYQSGDKINNRTGLFDEQKHMKVNLPEEELARSMFDEKALDGVYVGVIGGPEARLFAAMGADAVSIDPLIALAPSVNISHLTELPEYLGTTIAKQFNEAFDLTFSSRVFDRGSGLDYRIRFGGYPPCQNEIEVYQGYLKLIAQMTKKGGMSLHDGNMMVHAIRGNQDRFSLRAISPYSEGDSLDRPDRTCSSFIIFVLEKK